MSEKPIDHTRLNAAKALKSAAWVLKRYGDAVERAANNPSPKHEASVKMYEERAREALINFRRERFWMFFVRGVRSNGGHFGRPSRA